MLRIATILALLVAACEGTGGGLAPAPAGDGPRVMFDPYARPFPDVPLPNDVATRTDPSSPTGLRLNVAETGEIDMERRTRRDLNRLDGWGTYQPATVSFDQPLDLDDIDRRHKANVDFADDAVYIVNIDRRSPDFGKPVMIDMNRGNFPGDQPSTALYFPSDARQGDISMPYETVDEDTNKNNILDPGEDTDADGILDKPNVWPPTARPADGLLTHYDTHTNTLILRLVVPLRERSRYAVVLTNRLKGRNGSPVRSPFATIAHASQTDALGVLPEVFTTNPAFGDLTLGDVAFAWSFTTGTVTRDLTALREGLYGFGPFAALDADISRDVTPAPALQAGHKSEATPYILPADNFNTLASAVFAQAFGIDRVQVNGLTEDNKNIAYIVQGYFESPDFMSDESARIEGNTYDVDKVYRWEMQIDGNTGRMRYTKRKLAFTLVIPKATAQRGPPYPIAIYGHGFGQARIEPLGFAGILAKYGIASIGIDAWGHGIFLRQNDRQTLLGAADLLKIRPFVETLLEGQARDLNRDGLNDAGGDMWSGYAFHTRDTVRQSIVDTLALIRALRGFDGARRWNVDVNGDGQNDLAGDFDGDGTIDAGGPNADYYYWGSSMGGLFSGIMGGVEPAIRALAPVAGGAGLTSLTARSTQDSVRTDTVGRVMGPIVALEPVADAPGRVRLVLAQPLVRRLRVMPIAEMDALKPGMLLRLRNESKALEWWATVRTDGRAALHMKCDRDDAFSIEIYDGLTLVDRIDRWRSDAFYWVPPGTPATGIPPEGAVPTFKVGDPLRTPAEGWGFQRGSNSIRRMIGIAQTVLEPGDPVNFYRHHFTEPLNIRPDGAKAKNLLIIATLGDPSNPSDIHPAAARAAGVFDYLTPVPRLGTNVNDWLIRNYVLEGICGYGRFPPNADGNEVLFDPDALDRLKSPAGADTNGFGAPKPPVGAELRHTITTPAGVSGIRFGHMLPCGKHSFFITNPGNPFNVDEYLAGLAGYYFATGGRVILDDGCLENSTCEVPPPPPPR